jgi:uncharacterized protein
LKEIFQRILIPRGVFEEVVVRGAGQPGSVETHRARWITRRKLKQPDIANILMAELDQVEAEAIALALQEKADWLLIDERTGRRFAQQSGLKIKGTLGILVEGVRRGRIEDLRPILDEMIAKGTRVSPAVYGQVLGLAQEVRQAREQKQQL